MKISVNVAIVPVVIRIENIRNKVCCPIYDIVIFLLLIFLLNT
jgi:hypothetical protein